MRCCVGPSFLLAVVFILGTCQQPPPKPPPAAEAIQQEKGVPAGTAAQQDRTPGEVVATGVFAGRSGKPMGGARLVLGEVLGDEEVTYSKVKLVAGVSTAVADSEGRFRFQGFAPGTYTIVYQPAHGRRLFPTQIDIRPFLAMTQSLTPLLSGFELGKDEAYPARSWAGGRFTLLKGHTFYSEGPRMKIWNATARQGKWGPYMEIRRGVLWTSRFDDNSEIKFEAWSF